MSNQERQPILKGLRDIRSWIKRAGEEPSNDALPRATLPIIAEHPSLEKLGIEGQPAVQVLAERLRAGLSKRKPNWLEVYETLTKLKEFGPSASTACDALGEVAKFDSAAGKAPNFQRAGALAIEALLAIGPGAIPTLAQMVANGRHNLDLSKHTKESLTHYGAEALPFVERALVILIQHGSAISGQLLQTISDTSCAGLLATLERLKEHAIKSERPYDIIQISVGIAELKRCGLAQDQDSKFALESLLNRTSCRLDFPRLKVAFAGICHLTPRAKTQFVAYLAKLLETTHSKLSAKIALNQPILKSRWSRDANFRQLALKQNEYISLQLQDLLPFANAAAGALQRPWPVGNDLDTERLYGRRFVKFFERYIWLRACAEGDPQIALSRKGEKAESRLLAHKNLHTYAGAGLFTLYLNLAMRDEQGLQQNLLLDRAIKLSIYSPYANNFDLEAIPVSIREIIGARLADMYISGVVTSRHVSNSLFGFGERTIQAFFEQLEIKPESLEGLKRMRLILSTLRGVFLSVIGPERLDAKISQWEADLAGR